ncbi:2Fe-2S iron-sulfur cluster-binding protein [Chloroflexota bacterium]
MVKLTINDTKVEVEEGSTILEAANQAGIYIPTVCSHESLHPVGSCRVCAVEIKTNGQSSLTSACTHLVEAGLEVKTESDTVKGSQKLAVELLLAQQSHSPKIQALANKLGIEQPDFTLKEDECILCELCVRACNELVGVKAITFIAQGKDRDIDKASVLHSTEKCIGCDSCAYVCPTEAITVQDINGTRILTTPSGKIEFKLKKCKTCGKYWAPEKQIEHIAEMSGTSINEYDTCPDCRD